MPQNSTVTSPSRSSQARVSDTAPQDALHAVLRNALVCMDVQLEEELARYRRQKASGGRTIAQMGRRKSTPKTLELLDFSSPELPTQPPSMSAIPTVPTAGVPDTIGEEALWEEPTTVDSATAQPPIAADDLDSQLIPSLANLDLDSDTLNPESSDRPWDHDSPLNNHLTATTEMPDDYLESSEELLRSLAETEADIEVEQSFMQNLLTPLGLGSMLLLLVSSAIFGYVIMNPSSLSQLFAARNGNKPALDTPTSVTSPNGEINTQPPEPNLAVREFPEINSANLGTLKSEPGTGATKPTTKPGAKPTNTTPERSANSSSASVTPATAPASSRPEPATAPPIYSAPEPAATPAPQPDYRTYAPPARESSPPPPVVRPAPAPPVQRSEPPAPAPIPQAVAPTPATSPATGTDTYPYKIGIPYQSDQSLEEARKVVPDAFVRNGNDGAKVQVGASGSQADAEARAQELRNQGIPAEVYKP